MIGICNEDEAFHDLIIVTRTGLAVIIDDATGLQMGIHCHRAEILKPPLFQFLRNLVRKSVADRHRAFLMTHIADGLALAELP